MNGNICNLLWAYKVNYPLIHDVNHFNSVIAISTEPQSLKQIIEILTDEKDIIVTESMGVPSMKACLKYTNSRGIFIILDDTRLITDKTREKLAILKDIASISRCDRNDVIAAVFVIYSGRIPACMHDYIKIRRDISNEESFARFDKLDVVPDDDDIPIILHSLHNLENHKLMGLRMAAEFMNPNLRHIENNTYDEMLKILHLIEEDASEDDLSGLFVKHMLHLAKDGRFEDYIELPNLDMEAENKLQSSVFIEGDKLYMADKLFNEICEELLAYASISEIKDALKADGIIRTYQGSNVVKMSYYNIVGDLKREWMFEFNMNKLVSSDGSCKIYYFF